MQPEKHSTRAGIDRHIGPKDMFIVFCMLYLLSTFYLKIHSVIVVLCIIRLRCIHELLIPVSTPNRVQWLHFRGVGFNTPERLPLHSIGCYFVQAYEHP